MVPSSAVQSMSWTRHTAGVSVLLALEEHRKDVGHRAATLRDAMGLSQEDFAQKAGVSTRTVSRFETGRHDGRRSTVKKIAAALGIPEAELVGQPPSPLGLGESQLDRLETQGARIEAKLDHLIAQLPVEEPDEVPAGLPDPEPPPETVPPSVPKPTRPGTRRAGQTRKTA